MLTLPNKILLLPPRLTKFIVGHGQEIFWAFWRTFGISVGPTHFYIFCEILSAFVSYQMEIISVDSEYAHIGTQIAKFMGPTWGLSAPDGPHELSYQGIYINSFTLTQKYKQKVSNDLLNWCNSLPTKVPALIYTESYISFYFRN